MVKPEDEWFKNWFNSPYYHLLYKHRDESEAEFFLDNLIEKLKPAGGARILDLACGRGRHSIYLSKKGFDVTGVDLSPENIRQAAEEGGEGVQFFVHDMRNLLLSNYFDYVLNLFTSFGYFERQEDNQRVIHNMAVALKSGGSLVLDFFNAGLVSCHENGMEKTVENITFGISKRIEGNRIIKSIEVKDGGQALHFEEDVMLLQRSDFENYFRKAGLVVKEVYGSYALDAFDINTSERLIFVAEKP